MPKPVMHPSAAEYTSSFLRFYDIIVLQLSNAFLWCCSTQKVLLPLFRKHIGAQAHLDIGVGTGYYLAASTRELAEVEKVTLADLNPNALRYCENRMRRAGHKRTIETLEHDIFTPFPVSMHGQYDSISLFYTLHCLPGGLPEKANKAFAQIKPVLKPDGVVYGATILGQCHNWVGRYMMNWLNKRGVFSNHQDTKEGLEKALKEHFEVVNEVRIVGRVALFVAERPIQA